MTDSIEGDPFDAYAYQPTRRERAVMAAYGLAGAIRSTVRYARRALFTMRPTYVPLAVAVLVVTPTAAAMATWATLPATKDGMRMRGEMRVSADSRVPVADASDGIAATATADPRLQPTAAPMGDYAAPGGPDDGTPPTWLPEGLAPWWLDIVAAAHEHGLDSHAWGAIVAIECPWGDPNCGSPAGARGLAQIMAGTAVDIAAKSGLPCGSQPFDGSTSLRCGAFHFAELLRQNADIWRPGDELPALLAAAVSYNSGAGAQPRRAVREAATTGGDLCAGVAFTETANYCRRYRESWTATVAERGSAVEGDGQRAMVAP